MALLAGGMAVIAFAVRRRTRLSNGQSHGADGAA